MKIEVFTIDEEKDIAKEKLNQLKEHSTKHIEWFEEWIEEEKDDAEKVSKYKNAIEINSQIYNALEYALKCIDAIDKVKKYIDDELIAEVEMQNQVVSKNKVKLMLNKIKSMLNEL